MLRYILAFAIAPLAVAIVPLAAFAQSDTIAIDILIEPDATMMEKAGAWNERLRAELPQGFELDAAHAPHITLLQTFVSRGDLNAILNAVSETSSQFDMEALKMDAKGL